MKHARSQDFARRSLLRATLAATAATGSGAIAVALGTVPGGLTRTITFQVTID